VSNQTGTSLNISDGFGAFSRWSRPASQGPVQGDRQPTMARDGYTRVRHPDKLLQAPSYAALRQGTTGPR
jgi:hypothetical protein